MLTLFAALLALTTPQSDVPDVEPIIVEVRPFEESTAKLHRSSWARPYPDREWEASVCYRGCAPAPVEPPELVVEVPAEPDSSFVIFNGFLPDGRQVYQGTDPAGCQWAVEVLIGGCEARRR